jgi:hypothetical protein
MNTKRTMSQALHASNLGSEAMAFVAAGAATPPASEPEPEFRDTPSINAGRSTPPPMPAPPNFVTSPLPAERRGPVSITVRLPAELPTALLRETMERRLRGERPCTQQEIVAQALREWLERNAGRR